MTRPQARTALVVNVHARRGQALYDDARQRLRERGVTIDASLPIADPGRLPAIVADLVAREFATIVVGGGDGTITAVAGALAYKNAILGVLPLGTANSFARSLGLPLDLAGAVEVVAGGLVAGVDLGRIDDQYFANMATIGLPAEIGLALPPLAKRLLGKAAYPVVGLIRLAGYRSFACLLAYDDRQAWHRCVEVRVANGGYQGGVRSVDQASVVSRDLVVHLVKGRSPWSVVREWARIAVGRRPERSEALIVRGPDFLIDTDPPRRVVLDGEVRGETPVRATVARSALRVLVGPNGTAPPA